MGQVSWGLKPCLNLPSGHCVTGVQAVLEVSEPTSRALWRICAGCLSSIRTYLAGTVGQGCRLIKQCQNLAPGHRGVGCLSVVPTYLPGTVGQACRQFKHCRNLPPWHCWAVVQAV